MSAGHLRTQSSKKGKSKSRSGEDEEDGNRFVDSKMSGKILQIGQELADEDAAEGNIGTEDAGAKSNPAFDFESRFDDGDVQSDDEEGPQDGPWEDEEVEQIVCPSKTALRWITANEAQEVDPNDLDMFHKFVPRDEEDPIFHPNESNESGQGTNLADLILEKIAEHEAKQSGEGGPFVQGGGPPEDAVQLPAKAVEVYEK